MSCDIRKYEPTSSGDTMTLTAFVGGKNNGHSIQFTIDGKYCTLNNDALLDLVDTINRRLTIEQGYTATGEERIDVWYHEKTDMDAEK